ncbi:hypothetical protein HPB47_014937 [Ixodes persulcatus]|uniref:Uncharacterized protein n=1 Tax=Ixodes persulcatus TaxID=34615 RepID=A0AC60QYB6_IXOPE|nr:hypothetical protein HPB47_014937 [Ixodes persulcatus]
MGASPGTGDLNYHTTMGILEYIRREESYSPLKSFMNSIEELDEKLRSTDFYSKWQDVVFWSCQFNYRPCVSHCVKTFRAFMNNSISLKTSLSLDLTSTMVVLCHAIRTGDNTDWRFLLDHLGDADTAEKGHVIISALGCSKDAKNLQRYGQGPSLRDTVWYTLQSIRSSDSLNRMEHFYAEKVKSKRNARKLAPTFQSALELARSNMNWVAKNGRTIEKWINGRLADGAAPGA